MEMDAELFEANFFDIRRHRPKKGQVLAQFRASADFVEGWVKENVINILRTSEAGAESARKVMRNLVGAVEADSIKVPLQMTEDLLAGMTVDEVIKKDYNMVIEYYYWTKRELVPTDDPHWSLINVLNTEDIDKHFDFRLQTSPTPGQALGLVNT